MDANGIGNWAVSQSMERMGRREASEPVTHHQGVLCPPCANREHGIAADCWHGDCACKECNPRQWPDQCQHRELAVTGIPGVFLCLEEGCGEKIVLPELAETHRLSVASEPLEAVRASNANSRMLMDALKGHI
jgi:hypothetical protein